jgi:small-conductance mechanosensitive channel
VSSLFSGIVLLLDKSIKPGGVIEVGGTYHWGLLARRPLCFGGTRDGTEFLIPNEDIITHQVVEGVPIRCRITFKVDDKSREFPAQRHVASHPSVAIPPSATARQENLLRSV